MAWEPKAPKQQRRSLRLQHYDYSQAGAYFDTACAYQRECILGEIVAGNRRLNGVGHIVADDWLKTETMRDNVLLDLWVVMPNHFYGIVIIIDTGCRGTARRAPTVEQLREYIQYNPQRWEMDALFCGEACV